MIDVTAAGEPHRNARRSRQRRRRQVRLLGDAGKIAEKEERAWIRRAREIVKRYRDERPQGGPRTTRFNILWSNVQTLQPTLYARTPKPDVERRFHDQDPVGRLAAILLERCLAYAVDAFNFDAVMRGGGGGPPAARPRRRAGAVRAALRRTRRNDRRRRRTNERQTTRTDDHENLIRPRSCVLVI